MDLTKTDNRKLMNNQEGTYDMSELSEQTPSRDVFSTERVGATITEPNDDDDLHELYDFVILFPYTKPEEDQGRIKIKDARMILQDAFGVKDFSDVAKLATDYEYLELLIKSIDEAEKNHSEPTKLPSITRAKMHELTRKLTLEIIYKKCGLVTYNFFSRDKDEILTKVGFQNEEDVKDYAASVGFYKKLKKKYFTDEHFKLPPWLRYDIKHDPHFERGDAWGSSKLFNRAERVRLVIELLYEQINLGILERHGVILQTYMTHDKKKLQELRETWGALSIVSLNQPIPKIQDYFGSKVAMYFAYLTFYTKWLIPLAISGIILFTLEFFFFPDMEFIWMICTMVISTAWAGSYLQMWKRKNAYYCAEWGTLDFSKTEPARPQFVGTRKKNRITGQYEKWYEPKKRYIKYIATAATTTTWIAIAVALVTNIFIFRGVLKTRGWGRGGHYFCALLNAIQIQIFNGIYERMAISLTNWENHRTETQHENALTIKIFVFQIVNSFYSLFWIAFLKEHFEGCPEGEICNYMSDLRVQLSIIFAVNFMLNGVELAVPYMKYLKKVKQEEKHIEELKAEDANAVTRENMSFVESQAKLETHKGVLFEYLEIMIQYGYLLMFNVAVPILPLFGVLNNILEIRIDAFKFCNLVQRPFPHVVESIGLWEPIIRSMSRVGILSNLGVLIFTSGIVGGDFVQKLAYFIVIEHGLLLIEGLFQKSINKEPKYIQELKQKHEYEIKKQIYKLRFRTKKTAAFAKRHALEDLDDIVRVEIHDIDEDAFHVPDLENQIKSLESNVMSSAMRKANSMSTSISALRTIRDTKEPKTSTGSEIQETKEEAKE